MYANIEQQYMFRQEQQPKVISTEKYARQNNVYYCVSGVAHKSHQIKSTDRLQFLQRINEVKNVFRGTKFSLCKTTV